MTGDPACDVGSFATRDCTIPEGKALFFPILNISDTVLEHGGLVQINEMRDFLEWVQDRTTDLSVEVDGRPVKNIAQDFRVSSPVYSVTLPDNSVLNAIGEGPYAAGEYTTVNAGYYVMLQPLPVGTHTVHFKGKYVIPEWENWEFPLDIQYNITVAKDTAAAAERRHHGKKKIHQ